MKKNARPMLFCLLASAAVMVICSMNSWLYPLNPWNDVNCFVTVARGMLNGLVPYRDLFEQKGPLLYAIHALGLLISPNTYHGVCVMQILLMAVSLYAMYKIAREYTSAKILWGVVPCAMLLLTTYSYLAGDTAEELCYPMMMLSFGEALAALHGGKQIPLKRYVLHGVLAGCILWIKFNLLGFHLAWMSYLAVYVLIKEKSLKRPVKMCLCFLLGMALTAVPWLIYFGLNHALPDLVKGYFYNNIFNYHGRARSRAIKLIVASITHNPYFSASLIIGGLYSMFSRRFRGAEKGFIVWAVLLVTWGTYGRGVVRVYYYLVYFVFMPLFLTALGGLQERLKKVRIPQTAACAVSLAACVIVTLWVSPAAKYIGTPYEDTVQGQIRAAVGDEEDVTLLNVGCLDGGFYFALDTLPSSPWFCRLNMLQSECDDTQRECLQSGKVKYAVSRGTLDMWDMEDGFELVGLFESDYAKEVIGENNYYLYRRIEE